MTAWMPWDAGSPLSNVQMTQGFDVRLGNGASGGYPAPHTLNYVIRNADVKERFRRGVPVRSIEEVAGQREYPYPKSFFSLAAEDILVYWNCGGGGYGDPLERDPEMVLQDVKGGEVTIEFAREVYGVIIDAATMSIAKEETEQRRTEMRAERLREGTV